MKIPPSILINKKCHRYQWFLASKREWGLPKLRSYGHCHLLGWLLRRWGMQEARWRSKQDSPQIPEVLMNSVSPEACIYQTQKAKFLNSIPDLQSACCLCCKFTCSLTSHPASLKQFSQSYWDAISWAQSPKHSHQISFQVVTINSSWHFWLGYPTLHSWA